MSAEPTNPVNRFAFKDGGTFEAKLEMLTEKQIAKMGVWLRDTYSCGCATTLRELKDFATFYLQLRGIPGTIGDFFIRRIVDRNMLEISDGVVVPIPSLSTTVVASQQDHGINFFKVLDLIMTNENIEPENVWFVDDSRYVFGTNNDEKTVLVSSNKSKLHVPYPKKNHRCTVIEAVSATGERIAPAFVFDGEPKVDQWTHYQNEDAWVTADKDGHLSYLNIYKWLHSAFMPATKPKTFIRRRIIISDGHASYFNRFFGKACAGEEIFCLALPFKSPVFMNAFTKSAFSSISERNKEKTMDLSLNITSPTPLSYENFIKMYMDARDKSVTKSEILDCWKNIGIFPRNEDNLLKSLPAEDVVGNKFLKGRRWNWEEYPETLYSLRLELIDDEVPIRGHEYANLLFLERNAREQLASLSGNTQPNIPVSVPASSNTTVGSINVVAPTPTVSMRQAPTPTASTRQTPGPSIPGPPLIQSEAFQRNYRNSENQENARDRSPVRPAKTNSAREPLAEKEINMLRKENALLKLQLQEQQSSINRMKYEMGYFFGNR
ncbi:Transposase [Candida maltosa Xu316]|uniref:Transposase n=1 Tax=Candida maltosa (strain Xu316) TaxID=1245528 RepID=M3J469_CANMX|nr:Transposase [Candida maltosa Xu316]